MRRPQTGRTPENALSKRLKEIGVDKWLVETNGKARTGFSYADIRAESTEAAWRTTDCFIMEHFPLNRHPALVFIDSFP